MTAKNVYLDYASTTPVLPQVVEAMLPFYTEVFGNPSNLSNIHGNIAKQCFLSFKKNISNFLEISEEELFFTSGATESINHAIQGVFSFFGKGTHFLTCITEHSAVSQSFEKIKKTRS